MIEYEEDWLFPVIFRWRGSVYWRAALFAIPGALLAVLLMHLDDLLEDFRKDGGLHELNQSMVWSASTAVLLVVVGFRTKQGYSRFWEGTGLLHQMKGEWFDTVSNCVTFSISAKKDNTDRVWKFRHTIVRLMSLCHASALEEISGLNSELETIDIRGLDPGTLMHLKDCVEMHGFNKVEVLLHLIQSLITKAHEDGVLKVPAPILSRVFQTCSRGYVNLLNTKKITDTKFPFPFVQLITFLLLVHSILTPMMMSTLLTNPVTASVLTFMVLFGVHALNFISIELENPFGEDDNDLPLEHFQSEMNSCLLMLLHYNTDIIATASSTCISDFAELKATMILSKGHHEDVSYYERAKEYFFPALDPGPPPGFKKASKRLSEVGMEGECAAVEALEGGRPIELNCSEQPISEPGVCNEMGQSTSGGTLVTFSGPVAPVAAAIPGSQVRSSSAPVSMSRSGSDLVAPIAGHSVVSISSKPWAVQEPAPQEHGVGSEAKCIRALPEPKLVHAQGHPGQNPPSYSDFPLLNQNMDEFNQSMQCWTQMMENQLKDLSRSFTALNRLSKAVPRHSDIQWIG